MWQDLASNLLSTAQNLLGSGRCGAVQSINLAMRLAQIKLDQARELLSHIEQGEIC